MHALLVANPSAGRLQGTNGVTRLESALARAGLEVTCVTAAGAAAVPEALRAALAGRSPEGTRVVVAGGDGSVRAVLPALMSTGFALALLPVGSVNVLARELGIPFRLSAAARVAAAGAVRRIDLGLLNGQPFVLMAGIGFDAAVVYSVTRESKRLLGSAAYVAQGLSLLARTSPSRLRVTCDGECIEQDAWLAVVTNSPRYTYGWRISPAAELDDGWLDLALFTSNSLADRVGQVLAILRGLPGAGIVHRRARRLRLEADPPLHVQLDGDAAGMTPAEVEVLPGALSVVVPERPVERGASRVERNDN